VTAKVDRLLDRYPSLSEVSHLETLPIDIGETEISHAEDLEPMAGVTAAYVCLDDDTEALAAALALRAHLRRPGVRVVIAVRDEDSAVAEFVSRSGDVAAFGTLTHALSPEAVLRGSIETIAEAMHETFVHEQLTRGARPETNRALVPWSQLPDALKESNRRFAEGIGEKLEAVGCALVPAPLASEAELLSFSDAEVDRLARLEHERWARDLRRDGWQPTTGPRDPERKLHPLLSVSWGGLSEADRDKDRAAVRGLPAMLAAAGFAIYRLREPVAARVGDAGAERVPPAASAR
jgi:hypothetical protein